MLSRTALPSNTALSSSSLQSCITGRPIPSSCCTCADGEIACAISSNIGRTRRLPPPKPSPWCGAPTSSCSPKIVLFVFLWLFKRRCKLLPGSRSGKNDACCPGTRSSASGRHMGTPTSMAEHGPWQRRRRSTSKDDGRRAQEAESCCARGHHEAALRHAQCGAPRLRRASKL